MTLSAQALGQPQPDTLQGPIHRVLVFHIGSLGDTLVALPALWAVHDNFPHAHRTLLTKTSARPGIPVGRDIVGGCGLFDEILLFNGDYHAYGRNLSRLEKALGALRLWWTLRRGRYDLVVYLAPSVRAQAQIDRDTLFFRWAGIRQVIGARQMREAFEGVTGADTAPSAPVLARVDSEAELLLRRLDGSGLALRPLAQSRMDLALQPHELEAIAAWRTTLPKSQGRPWVAVAPGSNLQSKLWPLDRYEAVVRRLIEQHDVWPVIFGGPEDVTAGHELVEAWGRGVNTAGLFSVRQSAAALHGCVVYVGNDTGTMHLAASAGVPCVAVFSARDLPGKWEPLGPHHSVMRRDVPCAGCMLVKCVERDRQCLREITVDEVTQAAASHLLRALGSQANEPVHTEATAA